MEYMQAKVELVNSRATLVVDGKAVSPMAYCTHAGTRIDSYDQAKNLIEAGFKVFFLQVDSGWQSEESWQDFEKEAEYLLAADADVMIICRTVCAPPAEWVEENPDEVVVFEDGKSDHFEGEKDPYGYNFRRVCLASEKYAVEASRHICNLIEHLEARPVGKNVIGYFLLGTPGEWLYRSNFDGDKHCMGFSPAFAKFYGKWLARKYKTQEILKEAWNDPKANFESPRIPTRDEQLFSMPRIKWQTHPPARDILEKTAYSGYPHYQRLDLKGDIGNFLDPSKNQFLADFYEARNAGTAHTIELIAKAVKEKSRHDVVAGAFFGSLSSCWCHGVGNAGPEFLKDSQYVDFFSAPTTYLQRIPGGGASFRTPADGLMFRGKLWFNESDFRTYKNQSRSDLICHGQVYDAQQTREAFKREFAQVICDDVQSWWFDTEKNLDESYLLDMFKVQQQIAAEDFRQANPKGSEIAFVYDQNSVWLTDPETNRDLFHLNRIYEMPRIGAPADHIFLSDLECYDLSRYKMVVMLNCFSLDVSQREMIDKLLKNDSRTILWCYGSGVINPDNNKMVSAENVSDLTGFDIAWELGGREGTYRICEDNSLCRDLSSCCDYGRYSRPAENGFCWREGFVVPQNPSLCDPLFYADDGDANVFGKFITNSKPAVAIKKFGRWTSVFHGPKVLNSPILRTLAANAGVHIYSSSDDVFYANKKYISIHASYDGRKVLNLPVGCNAVQEIYSNQIYTPDELSNIEFDMAFGQTMTFRIF